MRYMTVGELVKKLRELPQDASVYMYSPYDDPDNGVVNAGGPIQGVRMVHDPDRYVETDPVVELWWEGF